MPLLVPQLDIVTIGAGGGSIAWVDRGGILRVGPQSAGAEPGPACHGKGGQEPTVTDANLVLGRIDRKRPLGRIGELKLNAELARQAVGKVAKPLGLSVEEAAEAIVKVVNANMAAAIRLISIARGHDPRGFTLMAFGGAGPLHANALIKQLDIKDAIIPLHPGLFCAMGCIMIPFQYIFTETLNCRLEEVDMSEVERLLFNQGQKGKELIGEAKAFVERVELNFEADMHYWRQTHYIKVPLPSATLSRDELKRLFRLCYEKERGQLVEGVPINLMNLKTIITGHRSPVPLDNLTRSKALSINDAKNDEIMAYHEGKELRCIIYKRERIPLGTLLHGPSIITEESATTFIEPGSTGKIDEYGNIIINC